MTFDHDGHATVGVTIPKISTPNLSQIVDIGCRLKALLTSPYPAPQPDALLELFHGHSVEASLLASALSINELRILEDAQLLRFDEGTVSSRFCAHVIEDLLVFTDPDVPAAQQSHTYLDPLWEARHLSRLLVRGRATTALDMGCGSGILALVLSSFADKVIGIDLNPRAVGVSRFNAALNGIHNVEFMEGDLFSPVAASRFERIIFNSPTHDEGDQYVSLLQTGEGILQRFLGSVPDRLTPNGYCHVNLGIWDNEDNPVSDKLRKWLGVHAHQYQLLLLTLSSLTVDHRGTLRRGWLSMRHGVGGVTELPYDYATLVTDPYEGSALIVAAMDALNHGS